MKNRDITAADVQAENSRITKKLYAALATATEERNRREDILQRAQPDTAAYTSAWDKYMRATFARAEAIKELERNHCHVPQ